MESQTTKSPDTPGGFKSLKAADYWCRLLEEHRRGEALDARAYVFHRWPSATTAARLHKSAGTRWNDYADQVAATLAAANPSEAVLFALLTLNDAAGAWELAHSLALDSEHTWAELIKAYEKIDQLAVLPIHQRLVENELLNAGAQHYRLAARRLAKMRKLAASSDNAAAAAESVDILIANLRETHRRRPRLQQEFDRAGLP